MREATKIDVLSAPGALHGMKNFTAVLVDHDGKPTDTYNDGVDDGVVVITNSRSVYDHMIRICEEYGSYGFEFF